MLYSKSSMKDGEDSVTCAWITNYSCGYYLWWEVDFGHDRHLLGLDLHCLYDGKENAGFHGSMGNWIATHSLLKLSPVASILVGNDNKFHGGQFWVSLGNQCCQKSVNILVCTLLWSILFLLYHGYSNHKMCVLTKFLVSTSSTMLKLHIKKCESHAAYTRAMSRFSQFLVCHVYALDLCNVYAIKMYVQASCRKRSV
jgi:hypothetical protein